MSTTFPATASSVTLAADRPERPINAGVVAVSAALLALGAIYLNTVVNWRHAALFIVGAFAGVVLYHAAFGFTTAWRVLVSDRRSAGIRAQMLMLALACAVFIPLLASGTVFGQTVRGSSAPLGTAIVAGAFIFGVGMQLGGGCASGTLYTAGGGNIRMLVTLAFFIIGSVWGTAHTPFWESLPSIGAVTLLGSLGAWGALLASLAGFGLVAVVAARFERAKHGALLPIDGSGGPGPRWLAGPWPLVWGAVGLVVVNVATLVLAGRPWGVTSAFALWGAKAAQAIGVDVLSWPYWAVPARAQSLQAPLLTDVTTVMNVGIMLGALAGAGLAGKFGPSWRVPARSLAAAALGGILLGYGARQASGCNIGAYFSGVASTSLHGWLWALSAFAGTFVGTWLRPVFGLTVERTNACPRP